MSMCFTPIQDIVARPIWLCCSSSYGLNGKGSEAVELYRRMPLDLVNERAQMCVLNACSHSGLLDEARSFFTEISTKSEKIYTAMVRRAHPRREERVSSSLDRLPESWSCFRRSASVDP